MDCRTIRNKLIPYLDGEVSDPERTAISAHLEACAACRAEVAALRESEVALRALAIGEDPPELTADLHRRLAAAGRPAHSHLGRWLVPAVAGAAALVLILWFWPHSQQPQQRSPVATNRQTTQPPVQRATVTPTPLPPPKAPSTVAVVRAPKAQRHHPARIAVRRRQPTITAKLGNLPPPDLVPEGEPARREPVEPVVLLVGDPIEPLPSSIYQVEVTLPNGDKSEVVRNIERHPSGEPRAVTISYRNTTP